MDESVLLFSRVSLSKFSLEALFFTLHFMGIRVFIVGCEFKCEKTNFSKTACFGESIATEMSREFQSPITRIGQAVLFVMQCFSWPDSSSSCMLHTCASFWRVTTHESVMSSNRESPSCCTLSIKSSHSLTHNPYIILT